MTPGFADIEAPWLAWMHVAWFPVLMAFGAYLAHRVRLRLAASRAAPCATVGVLKGVDVAVLSTGAVFAVLVLWLEFGAGKTVLFHIRALLNEPSMGLVAFSLFSLARRGFGREAMIVDSRRLLAVVAVIGVVFYPLALGIGYFDPYAQGYHAGFAVLVFALALPAWWFAPTRGIAFWLTLALFAWSYRLPESANLWDALLDPLLFFIALGSALPRLWAWLVVWVRGRRRGATGSTP